MTITILVRGLLVGLNGISLGVVLYSLLWATMILVGMNRPVTEAQKDDGFKHFTTLVRLCYVGAILFVATGWNLLFLLVR